jgi:glutathione synthase/RimK-type ligase-like ATP-grasp enzyme
LVWREPDPHVTVIFATCHNQPLIAPDDEPLAAALRARGVIVTPMPWTEIDRDVLVDAPAVLLRSTWDYHRSPALFGSWLKAVGDSGRTVWNQPSIARGNIDKVYLEQLQARGIAIPKTRWLDRADQAAVRHTLADEGWDRAVLKPRIAATAYGTFLVTPESELSDHDLVPTRASGALLQEFVPEIESRGEISAVYCDGVFSHAVLKRAKAGDYRVQQDFGGSVEPMMPSPELRSFTDHVMSTVDGPTLYARVDVVETGGGPLLMELELIEPELYFLYVPAAALTFARAIARRLGSLA